MILISVEIEKKKKKKINNKGNKKMKLLIFNTINISSNGAEISIEDFKKLHL